MKESAVKYPPWVSRIMEKIRVTIYRGKSEDIVKRQVPISSLSNKPLSVGKSEEDQKAFVVGFEDEESLWNEKSDIAVKIYNLKEPKKYRIEIFCSGVNRKEIYYEESKILNYEGYKDKDIESRKQIVGTVIFDVTF